MKKTLFLISLFTFLNLLSYAQLLNQKITNNKTGEEILIGECTIEAFLKDGYEKWYRENYGTYKYNLKKEILDSIKADLDGITIIIVMGTWCSDSRLHFPEFMSILDYMEFDEDKLTIIAVDRNKNAATVPIDYLDIVNVPTFIIYKDKKELGRIIETPAKSLEEDLDSIMKGSYTQKEDNEQSGEE